MPRSPKCPICGRPVSRRGDDPYFPFCSERCRLVDLGRWFGEEYRIPGARAGDGGPAPRRDDGEDEP